ncbi:DUF4389 domain-containing protein [Halopseudomonas sabulinigri]|uniref:DUF4389 domain-containing protein n=1 Tax=Halopseudomonas sabulinigri TaxID=472181 RepID=A0A1H1N2L4_9GAMM|nr:DUF4389 domain-containing protein [Halopseudomonas sabulinigri]SDR93202.1 protein of unknown function [Halopseudomonas sabulinigri]
MSALKTSLCSADFWLRLLYTFLFMLAWQVVEILLALLVVIQILARLFTGSANQDAVVWGEGLSVYACQIGRYVTMASEQKPWPFIEWPQPAAQAADVSKPAEPTEPKA